MDYSTILEEKVQAFIHQHLNDDIRILALKKSPFKAVSSKDLVQQIQGKKTAQKKMPTWFTTAGIVYPPKVNLEQASSELTAQYKSQLLLPGKVVDLTGGFGIDDYYFSKIAEEVFHCEMNQELADLVALNASTLGLKNIRFIQGDSRDFLKTLVKVENIYVDPSRRNSSGRTFLLEDCEPNVVADLALYLEKAERIIIKAAPVLDIQAALSSLKYVNAVHIVSVNNECKELLFVIDKKCSDEVQLICTLLNQQESKHYSFLYHEEKSLSIDFCPVQKYLYEPDVAFLKAGLFKTIARRFNVCKLHQHSHLYTSAEQIENFPGRSLKVKNIFDYKDFSAKKSPVSQANVIARNFLDKPELIKKKLKINDGGKDYLYFTTDCNDHKKVILAELI